MPHPNKVDLDEMTAWYLHNRVALESRNVEVDFKAPSTGLSKNSASLGFMTSERVVEVVIWDSGEFDVGTLILADEGYPTWEVDDLSDGRGIARLLDRVVAELS